MKRFCSGCRHKLSYKGLQRHYKPHMHNYTAWIPFFLICRVKCCKDSIAILASDNFTSAMNASVSVKLMAQFYLGKDSIPKLIAQGTASSGGTIPQQQGGRHKGDQGGGCSCGSSGVSSQNVHSVLEHEWHLQHGKLLNEKFSRWLSIVNSEGN